MHVDLATVRSDIREITGQCYPQWSCEHELDHLKDQRRHMNMIHTRVHGGKWQGSKEGQIDDQFRDVDKRLRPITKPQYYNTKSKDTNIDPKSTRVNKSHKVHGSKFQGPVFSEGSEAPQAAQHTHTPCWETPQKTKRHQNRQTTHKN